MNKTHIRAYTKALVESSLHRQTALEIELSVGLAVMHECEPSRRLGRETLLTIYNGAGWQCGAPGSLDWRAINRRITASIALYEFMMPEVFTAAETAKVADLVNALRPMIAALKVKSVNEVLLACDKVRAPRKPQPAAEGTRIDAGHIHVVIPKTATRDDLIALATKLMQMATERFEQPAAAEPESIEALAGADA